MAETNRLCPEARSRLEGERFKEGRRDLANGRIAPQQLGLGVGLVRGNNRFRLRHEGDELAPAHFHLPLDGDADAAQIADHD